MTSECQHVCFAENSPKISACRSILRIATVFLISSMTTACSVSPAVTYSEATAADLSGSPKFHLRSTYLLLNAKARKKDEVELILSVTPLPVAEKSKTVYQINAGKRWGVKTNLKVTYMNNTRLISSLGTEIVDERAKLIGEIGKVIVAVLAAADVDDDVKIQIPTELPVVIDVEDYREKHSGAVAVDLPKNDDWTYTLNFSDIAIDKVATSAFFGKFETTKTDLFPVEACQTATLTLKKKKIDISHSFVIRVANPAYVQPVGMPRKGKIDMHTACGANITAEKSETSSAWAILSTILEQAKSIKKEQENDKSETKTDTKK